MEEKKQEFVFVEVPVHCDAEMKQVGILRLAKGVRPKVLQPDLVHSAFVPSEERYRLPASPARSGQYFHCPHCQGHLCIEGEKKTGEAYPPGHPKAGKEAPSIKGAVAPIILGRTQIQVS